MGSIAKNTDFIGRFYVSNQIDSATVAAQLNNLVSTYEPVFLRMLLGPAQYELFKAWYNTDPLPVNTTWSFLIAGGNYEKGGSTCYAPPVKELILAYLYDKWNRENLSQTAAMGEVETDSQNASPGTATYKVVDRWNEMAAGCSETHDYLVKNLGASYRGDNRALPEIFRYINRLDL